MDIDTDIVIAAEKTSIAGLLSDYTHCPVRPEDIDVSENPDETGSFLIDWRFDFFEQHFTLAPDGHITAGALDLKA